MAQTWKELKVASDELQSIQGLEKPKQSSILWIKVIRNLATTWLSWRRQVQYQNKLA